MKFTERISKLNQQRPTALPALFRISFPSTSHPHNNSRAPPGPGPVLQDVGQAWRWTDTSSGPGPAAAAVPSPWFSLASRGRCPPSAAPRPPDGRRLGLPPRLRPVPLGPGAALPGSEARARHSPALGRRRRRGVPGAAAAGPHPSPDSPLHMPGPPWGLRKRHCQPPDAFVLTGGKDRLSNSFCFQETPPPRALRPIKED